ncbi:UDP-4-amino-4,6-dideoxy-N-acetyl-beta-L-altrosamine N-acetyltransferase [Paenibacillus hunanensis]|uniref:UDP-4-amino-4, 6-dideoxy-N-acetyl-beta-L-altrosamine N-acetyltransferase n=1 Tax=Paenibacillus hunanensis TaxID=539262 RepID=UPI002A69B4E7|nr:UDP-4-amino-4,6-dideoxy-N-acetyl-beta-L-altrosamine N-acetyltransferase [Paenibacillus hunanensis]WPP42027.1 UDP-4-amino-4,6-dideoxy-N-acetyl-beta-L-altrosamine N-acetyltransferase [Paenibacillus hunanensis]
MHWRMQPHVTKYMFSDIQADMDRQKQWFEAVSKDDTQCYWIIMVKDKPVGLLSLNDINRVHRRCSWAFYIGDESASMIGMMLAPYVYHYVFEELGFHKITGEVMEGNDKVRKMHVSYGCTEAGCQRQHIFKYGVFHDVYVYEMLNEQWQQHKGRFARKHARFE